MNDQARMDAEADAATLRLQVYSNDLCQAAGEGLAARHALRFMSGMFDFVQADVAVYRSIKAAHAAFKAVPGLR